MRLKAIELKGFKSFAQRTRIEFPSGISAIVGPNGCGKSNIIDAVRWVLGEQASGALRAKKMQDVIFSGTEHRARQNYAEVSLFFDGAQRLLEDAGEELSIRRILHRSGESIYSIDDKDVRLKDVRELLMDTGIGVSGYSLISQGDIEDILSESGFNRRKIFEEASGTSLLTAKKLEATRRLGRVESNIERISDIYVEVESRVEPLKEASEKARKYLELKEQMEDAELYYALNDFERYDREAKEWQIQLSSMRKQEEGLKAELLKKEELALAAEKAVRELEEEHDALRERQRGLMEERDGYFLDLRLKEERKMQNSSLERQLRTSIEEAESRQVAASEGMEELNKDVSDKEQSFLELKARVFELEESLQEKNKQLAFTHQSQEEYEEGLRSQREQFEAAKATELLLHEQKMALERSLDGRDFDAQELKEKVEEIRKSEIEKETERETLSRKRAKTAHSFEHTKNEQVQLHETLRAEEAKKTEIQNQVAALDKEQKLLEGLESHHLQESADVEDLLLHHIKVKRGYEKAAEAVLGLKLQAVLRRDVRDVFSQPEAGGSYLLFGAEQARSTPPNKNSLLSFVETENEYSALLSMLLEGVQVVASLEEVPCRAGETYVTKEGALLSGPYLRLSSDVQAPLLSFRARREEIEEEQLQLEKALDVLERSIRDHELEAKQLREQAEEEEKQLSDHAEEKDALEHALRELRHERELFEQRISQLDEQAQREQQRLHDLAVQLEENISLREQLSQKIESLQKVAPGSALSLEEDAKTLTQTLHEQQLELARSEGILRAAQSMLEEKRRSAKSEQERLSKEQEQLNELILRQQSLQEEMDTLREKHSATLLSIEELDTYVMELRKQMADKRELKEKQEQEKRELDERQRALLSEISSLDVKFVRVDERRKSVSEDIWENYQMSILQLRERFAGREVSTTRSELRSIRQSMLALEPVNLDSIEEFAQVSEREEFLRTQLDDLQKAREDLHRTLASLERRMRGDFKKTFEEIRGYFQDIFRELFRGGEGDIRLEEDKDVLESDILIYASPPGKKLVHMNLLSGGEKAMTAIALLFSVLRAKPSPFYILDEVEAALDDVNIQRFGEFLKTFSVGSQFILITHRKGTMEYAKALYGVSMEEKGVSTLVSIDFEEGGRHGRAI